MTARAPAVFHGPLAREFEGFLAFRQDLATCHEHLRVALRHLDRFLIQHAPDAHDLTGPLVDAWMATLADRGARTRRNYFRVARQVCVFRARADPTAFIPDAISCPRVTARFRPYIYSEQEIRALITAAARLSGALRPHTYVTLLLVLYTTGLRIGEAIRLHLGDLDRDEAVLRIRAGKFRKARLVPITTSLCVRLDTYLKQRRKAGAPTHADAPLFWSPRRGPYSLIGVQSGISRLLRAVCGKRPGRGTGPRVHDIRHSSGTPIIPATDGQCVQLPGRARSPMHRWRNNQSVFRKAKTRSRNRSREDRRQMVGAEKTWIHRERAVSIPISMFL